MIALKDLFRLRRESRGITQREMGKLVQSTMSHVSRLEGGSRDPSLRTLRAYAAASGGPISLLIEPDGKVSAGERHLFIDIVFDGPPGPEAGRFVEVENPDGASISVGEWIDRGDGFWALRIRSFT